MANLTEYVIRLRDQASAGMAALGKNAATANTAMLAMGTSLGPIGGSLASLGGLAGKASFALLGVGAAVAGVAAALGTASRMGALGEELDNLSRRSGVAVEPLQGLRVAFEDVGVGGERLTTSLRFLNRSIAAGKEEFAKIGVATTDSSGQLRATEEVMLDVASAFSRMEDGATKTATAMALFGREGESIIPALNLGRVGLEKFMQQAREAGLVIDKDAIAKLKDLDDSLDALKRRWDGFKLRIGVSIATVVEGVMGTESERTGERAGQDIEKALALLDPKSLSGPQAGETSSDALKRQWGRSLDNAQLTKALDEIRGDITKRKDLLARFREVMGRDMSELAQIQLGINELVADPRRGNVAEANRGDRTPTGAEQAGLEQTRKAYDALLESQKKQAEIAATKMAEIRAYAKDLGMTFDEAKALVEQAVAGDRAKEIQGLFQRAGLDRSSPNLTMPPWLEDVAKRLEEQAAAEKANLERIKEFAAEIGITIDEAARILKAIEEKRRQLKRQELADDLSAMKIEPPAGLPPPTKERDPNDAGDAVATAKENLEGLLSAGQVFTQTFSAIVASMEQSIAASLKGMLRGTMSFKQAMTELWRGIKDAIVQQVAIIIARLIALAVITMVLKALGVPVGLVSAATGVGGGGGGGAPDGGPRVLSATTPRGGGELGRTRTTSPLSAAGDVARAAAASVAVGGRGRAGSRDEEVVAAGPANVDQRTFNIWSFDARDAIAQIVAPDGALRLANDTVLSARAY